MISNSKAARPGHGDPAPAHTFTVDPDVVAQRAEDEILLIHLRTNAIFELNRTGARFWDLLREEGDIAAIRPQMLHEYDVDEAVLDQEISDLLAALLAAGLIRAVLATGEGANDA